MRNQSALRASPVPGFRFPGAAICAVMHDQHMATSTQRQSIQEYLTKMDDQIDVRKWKAVKTLGIAIVFFAMYYVAVDAGADPTGRMFWAILVGTLLVAGVELSELELLAKLKNASIDVDLGIEEDD